MSNLSSRQKPFRYSLWLLLACLFCAACLGAYYFSFIAKLIKFPLAISVQESWDLVYVSCGKHSASFDCPVQSFQHSLFFIFILQSFTKFLSSAINQASFAQAFFIANRIASFAGLIASFVILWLIQSKEGLKPFVRLICILMLMATPLIQEVALQGGAGNWALALGLLSIYRFMTYVRKDAWPVCLMIGCGFGLSFALSHNLVFVALPLSCFAIHFSVKNISAFKKVLLSFALLVLLDFIVTFAAQGGFNSGLLLPDQQLGNYNPSNNLYSEVFYSWPIWSFAVLLIFMAREKIDLRNNPIHPAGIIAVLSTLFNWLSSLFVARPQYSWVVTVFALAWLLSLQINKLFETKKPKLFLMLASLTLCLGLLSPFMQLRLLRLMDSKPELLNSTQSWLKAQQNTHQQAQTAKSKKRKKKNSTEQVFSQDPSLNVLTGLSKEEIYEVSSLFNDDSSSKASSAFKLKKALQNQKFSQVITSQYLPLPEYLKRVIKQNYLPQNEILVAGNPGYILSPGYPSEDKVARSPQSGNSSRPSSYATFSRV